MKTYGSLVTTTPYDNGIRYITGPPESPIYHRTTIHHHRHTTTHGTSQIDHMQVINSLTSISNINTLWTSPYSCILYSGKITLLGKVFQPPIWCTKVIVSLIGINSHNSKNKSFCWRSNKIKEWHNFRQRGTSIHSL